MESIHQGKIVEKLQKTPAEVSCLLHVGGLKPGGSAGYRIGYFHEEIKPSILHIRDSPDPFNRKFRAYFLINLVDDGPVNHHVA
jgi:hypothetical protein